ncbi:MAG: hypothetical protein COA69_08195 [Robiginitomaculum sp.]|nr:MAG: hypothetical protein COA69_08195 [Robiginitomaculum sp.]
MSLDLRAKFIFMMAIGYGVFAVFWALAPYTSINFPARFIIDVLDWPIDNTAQPLSKNTQWLSSIGAGLLASLAILLGGIIAPAAKTGDVRTVRIGFWAILIWYVIDSVGSVASGVASNAVFNTLFAVPLLLPMYGLKAQAD